MDEALANGVVERFKDAVRECDALEVNGLLTQYAYLRENIDQPWFSFDAPAIVYASSDRKMAEVLLKHGADINAKSRWWAGGFGVLHQEDADMIRYFVARGAHIDAHAAASLGRLDLLQDMVAADPSIVNQRGPDGQSPLHFAKSREIIDFLLDHGANLEMRDLDHGGTPAQWAVDDASKCRYLIECGATVDIFMACVLEDASLVRRVLAENPDCWDACIGEGAFTAGDSNGGHIYLYTIGGGMSPLGLVARSKNAELIDLTIRHCSTPQQFLFACLRGDTAIARSILTEYPDIMNSLGANKDTALGNAAWNHQEEAVRTMLEVGFPPDAAPDGSSTPLHRAIFRGYKGIVELLLAYGASVDITNEYGGTPLSACVWGSMNFRDPRGDYAAVAECLIRAGAKLPEQADGSSAVRDVLLRNGVSEQT